MKDTTGTLIVGAGAGGLALGHYLAKAGHDFLIVEQGRVGQSWRMMPDDTHLLSPWWTNVLPGTRVPLRRAHDRVSSARYADYLQEYAAERALPLQENCTVRSVRPSAAGFRVETGAGAIQTHRVVCASGYYQNPYTPSLAGGSDGSVATLHAAAYRGPEALARSHPRCRRVLVVGRRITAGQIMVELHAAGYQVALASRGPVQTRAKWRRARVKEELYFAYERLFVKLFPNVRAKEKPIMDGGPTEALLRSGAVAKVDGVQAIREGAVVLLDGKSWPCDLVLYATGYRPALGFLQDALALEASGLPRLDGMQSAQLPGLHFLGLDNLRNFLSPYLRGLAADARVLARALARAR